MPLSIVRCIALGILLCIALFIDLAPLDAQSIPNTHFHRQDRPMTVINTKEKIMGIARLMVQAHGYNALSFREIGKAVGISSASIHHHFATKGDLGAALALRYTEDGSAWLAQLLSESKDPHICMTGYIGIFRAALLNENRMCLVGLMAAEYDDLPPEVRVEVDHFTDVNVKWLSTVLAYRKSKPAKDVIQDQALAIFAAMGGAQLVARGRGDIATFDRAIAAYRASGLIP